MSNSNYSDWDMWNSEDSQDDYNDWTGYGPYGDGNEGPSFEYGDPLESEIEAYENCYEDWEDDPREYLPDDWFDYDEDDFYDEDMDWDDNDEEDVDGRDADDMDDCDDDSNIDIDLILGGRTPKEALADVEIDILEEMGIDLTPELELRKQQLIEMGETPVQIGNVPVDTRPFEGEPGFFIDLERSCSGNLTPKKVLQKYLYSVLSEHYFARNGQAALEAEKTALEIADKALDIDKDAEIMFTTYDENDTVLCLRITMNLLNSKENDVMLSEMRRASFCEVRRVVCSRFELCAMFRNYWKAIR